MGHHHHHHHAASEQNERSLWKATAANMLLTLAQVVGGIISGSLSLIADALHNFSDAASLLIALVAVRIGRKPPDQMKTFGYKRAETVAALINLTTLVIIGVYLCYEAATRFFMPAPISGWIVMLVAGIALVVDLYTAALTYRSSKTSMNMRAAFLHNVTDALSSVGVIIAGALIILFNWVWVDAAMTLLIAGYVLYHGFAELPRVIHLLMEGTPEGVDVDQIIKAMEAQDGVASIHHVHIWQIDEHKIALEGHVVLSGALEEMETVKQSLKKMLHDSYGVEHSTLEFETAQSACNCEDRMC